MEMKDGNTYKVDYDIYCKGIIQLMELSEVKTELWTRMIAPTTSSVLTEVIKLRKNKSKTAGTVFPNCQLRTPEHYEDICSISSLLEYMT